MNGLPPLTVAHAAAGCGKTTDLARRYLDYLASGLQVEEVVAITFTRRAAAELQERVALALRAAGQGADASRAREALGSAWSLYEPHAPRSAEAVERALLALPDAPIGTTDAFVQRLLTEFALDARLPLGDGRHVLLDVPIRPGAGLPAAMDRAARRVLDPPDGTIDPDVAALLPHLTLDEIRRVVARPSSLDDLAPAPATVVLGRLAHQLADVCQKHGLASIYLPGGATEATAPEWQAALEARTNEAGRWAIPAVARWLADPKREPVPYELTGWLLGVRSRSKAEKALRKALEEATRDFGMARLALWDVVQALEYPYDELGHVELADDLRQRLHRLRQRVGALALEQAALAGELGYDQLLDAAIALCQHPPERLCRRFRALLVDEVQDANPAQMRFYNALASLPPLPSEPPISTYYVGDARQSIYLFRNAEPQGLIDLQRLARAEGNRFVELATNHRSAPRLVGAHRDLFAALDGPMRTHGWNPPAALDGLAWREDNASLDLDPALHDPAEPVWILRGEDVSADEADEHALHAFFQRVQAAWAEPGHAHDTAAVLAPTWRQAEAARDQLRRWAGTREVAWVDGATGWASSRAGEDVAWLLRALADATDDVAWLAVLKHPSVGLSDSALARARAGVGLWATGADGEEATAGAPPSLGRMLDIDRLGAPHLEVDQRAFARALRPLREAREQLGRRDVAEVVDRLATTLNWRGALAAGPGGDDDVARFEVLLDWLRTMGGDGWPLDAVVAMLEEPDTEPPRVHLERPGQHVVCTTVHQAKGLAWDHVCVLSPGQIRRGGRNDAPAWIEVGGERMRLEGVSFDPFGGITPFPDPLARLARKLHEHRHIEETARLLYVAVTRARRSVTLAPATRRHRGSGGEKPSVATLLRDAWLSEELQAVGVAVLDAPSLPDPEPPPTGWARVAESAPPWPLAVAEVRRDERTPSSMGAHLGVEGRVQLAESVVHRVRLANGLHLGTRRCDPGESDPDTGLPPPGHRLEHLEASDWGDLAHGWLAAWGFRGAVTEAQVEAWLAIEWGHDPLVRDWLVAVSHTLRSVGGPLWAQVTDPSATLHFELPLVGLGTQQDREVLISGRTDLLVERPGKRLTVIDFKAGATVPTGWSDLAEGASLRTYAPQLDAYAEAFHRMGYRVEAVALWFARTGTSVLWVP